MRQMSVFSEGRQDSCPPPLRKTDRWREIAAPFRAEFLSQHHLPPRSPLLNVEEEVADVAVFDGVVFAFELDLALVLGGFL